MLLHDLEEDPSTAFRSPAPLFPVPESPYADAHHGSESGLAQAMLLSQTADIGFFKVKNAGGLPVTSEDLSPFTHAVQQFGERLLLHGYSFSTSRRRASR